MTLQELWELFPIVLTPHQPHWKEWAITEIEHIAKLLGGYSPTITHIGSTAVPDIMAKPIVDILVEIPIGYHLTAVRGTMEEAGYICMSSSETRISLNKGYTPDGFAEKVFHVHVRRSGDNDEIYFLEYLKNNPAIAREYELLKLGLLTEFRNNRDGYTEAKTEFVKRITRLAKNHYEGK